MSKLKGYKQTDEHKKKRSDALKTGQFFNCIICGNEFWRKQFDIKKGNNKFCSKNCYFEWQKGRSRSEEFKKKCRSRLPEKNGNWKGGITPINKKIRASEPMRVWREKVFKRDDWTCQKCGARSKKNKYIRIEAHHIKPFATFPELRLEIKNGITLCKKCHSLEPKGKEIWEIK